MHELRASVSQGCYDWTRFGRHRFRAPAGVLIDSPLGPAGSGWLGTLWPDHNGAVWSRLLWTPDAGLGGWTLPIRLAGGDVIEFGADTVGQPVRWYGIVDSYDAVEWLTLQGPYADPAAAHLEAVQLLAHDRYQPPLRALSTRTSPRCRRVRR